MSVGLEQRVRALERENARLRQSLDDRRLLGHFQEVAEFLREVFWIVDPADDTVRYVSPSYEVVWGRPCQSLYEDPDGWIRAIHPDDRARVAESFHGRSPGENWLGEYRIQRPDGEVRWISDRSLLVATDEGVLLTGLAEDITDRKDVEQRVRAREAELAHVQRLGTMGEMAASMAHELNQPLSAIVTHAEVCKLSLEARPVDASKLLADLEDVVVQAERAGRIIRQLRRFVRKQEPQRTDSDLNGLVAEALEFAEPEARNREVRFATEYSRSHCSVFVDRVQVQQIVLNLVRNAIEAVAEQPAQRRQILVATRCGTDAHEVFVRDFGARHQDDLVDRIFEPFYTTRESGLGMGLPISRSLAEAHGGTLTAMNEPEGGLTLCLQLPQNPDRP